KRAHRRALLSVESPLRNTPTGLLSATLPGLSTNPPSVLPSQLGCFPSPLL
ncbi:DNA-directed RNA polymerase subunit B'', partial [Dissostichus eleginoides]